MTTQAEAIRELIEKIEAEELQEYYNPSQFKAVPFGQRSRAASAFMGSLDSAMALHEALLPEASLSFRARGGASKFAIYEAEVDFRGVCYDGQAQTHARAMLIAILKAYLAEMEGSVSV